MMRLVSIAAGILPFLGGELIVQAADLIIGGIDEGEELLRRAYHELQKLSFYVKLAVLPAGVIDLREGAALMFHHVVGEVISEDEDLEAKVAGKHALKKAFLGM